MGKRKVKPVLPGNWLKKFHCLRNMSKNDFQILRVLKLAKSQGNKEVYLVNSTRNVKLILKGTTFITYQFGELQGLTSINLFAPAFHGCFVDKGTVYVLEEFLEDYVLVGDFGANNKLTENDILSCLAQLSVGLYQLYKNGFVHGDLHTFNVFISKSKPYKIKIFDFDLMRHVPRCTKYRRSSFNYSPEECRKLGFSHKVDIWSLGRLLLYLLKGKPNTNNWARCEKPWDKKFLSLDNVSKPLVDLVRWMKTYNQNYRPDIVDVLASPVLFDVVFNKINSIYENDTVASLQLAECLSEIRSHIERRRAGGRLRRINAVLPPWSKKAGDCFFP